MTTRVTWPADQFFWSLLEAPGVKRAGELPAGLLPMLEDDVPLESPDLHAVCVPMSGGRLAVCAVERSTLATIHPETLVLTPDALPPFLQTSDLSPDHFSMLVGSFEPLPIRSRRIRHHALLAVALLLCGALIALGLHRRAVRWDDRAQSARAAAASVASRVIASGDPAALAAEAAQLRLTHDTLARMKPPIDAPVALAAILQVWPTSVPTKPQSISVGSSGISISTAAEGDAAEFLSAFSPPPGWRLDEPRLSTSGNVTRLTLHLRPTGGKP
jgi:hypothetical protein